jgi:hypothetical protein
MQSKPFATRVAGQRGLQDNKFSNEPKAAAGGVPRRKGAARRKCRRAAFWIFSMNISRILSSEPRCGVVL